ncbi:hypothetical protein ACFCX4_30585, partial [Kitasatospora sp. NPDC056327]|uniref:DUF7927 domain-containing protein n=1 Tax=Kitasatospora sp. NPDC056327 TaxID=3345785 RepID=UPI0035D759F0
MRPLPALGPRVERGLAQLLAQVLVLLLVLPSLVLLGAGPASAQTWAVEGQNVPSVFDCDHLYYSNFRSGMQFANAADGAATVRNTVISKRVGAGLPDYWSTNMAMGTDPDTGRVAAFYSSYTTSNLKLYKHVSGTDTVTDQIAGGATRNLPGGVNWGGLGANPRTGMLYGAQNGGAPVLFEMNLATGATRTWSRGSTLTSVPANDPVFASGTLVPDIFVDVDGGVYYGIVYAGATYVYRLDPATGTTVQVVRVTGAGAGNGFNNYGMAFFDGAVYLGYYGGALYRVDPRTGVSVQVAGGNAQDNQTGRITSESGGSWPITDLAGCAVAPNLTSSLVVAKTAEPRSARPGESVRYTLTVRNDGAVPVTGAELADDLGGVLDDALYNDDASATTTGPGGPAPRPVYDAATRTLRWNGDVGAGATVTITYSVRVAAPPAGDAVLRNTVTVPGSNCGELSTDPACTSTVPLARLAVRKSASPATPQPGSAVTYTVTLTNDGEADWTGATLTDDLTDVVDDAVYNDDATARTADGATAGTVTYTPADRTLRWTGTVARGSTVTVTYSVRIGSPPAGNKRLTNRAVGPDGSNCPAGATDPACATDESISGLVLAKSVSATSAKPGDTVTYTVTAENAGGAIRTGVTVTDDLSGLVDDADYRGDAVARTGGAPAPTQPSYDAGTSRLAWTGDLAPGQRVVITYSVTVRTPPTGDRVLRNAVTGPTDSSCPPGTADPSCGTVTPLASLTIAKTVSAGTVTAGERLTWTVTVTNTGRAAYPGASFTDDLTGVLDDAGWDAVVTATSGTTAFDPSARRFGWQGDVPTGAAVTVTYRVTVGSPPAGDKRLRNAVTGPDGSNCPAGGTDPSCGTETTVRSLRVAKSGTPDNPRAGDTVKYTLTVTNDGTAPYPGASFTDDLTGVLDDAGWDAAVTATSGTAAFDPGTRALTWNGDLAVGATATVTYTVTVTGAGDKVLRNTVTAADSNCPPGSADPACRSVIPRPLLSVRKSAAPASARPGETVTYTLTVTNSATDADYRAATVTDDLTGVLDDAGWNATASATSGSTAFDPGTRILTWSGDVPRSAAVTITYGVTVGTPPAGDKVLRNAVTGPADSSCPPAGPGAPAGADPACGTVTPVATLAIAKTAVPAEARPGERVTWTVTVTSTGEAPYPGASFTDDLTGVLDDATWDDSVTASTGTAVFDPAARRLGWTGDLAREASATVTYTATVARPPTGDHHLRNAVTGPAGSTCPAGGTDPACATDTLIARLVLTKTAAPTSGARPGGKVTWTVTAANPGTAPYPGASFTDDLSGVLDDAAWNDDATATLGSVERRADRLHWSADLPAGARATVTYSVTVGSPPAGDKVLRNAVTGPADSTCEGLCAAETPVGELRIQKSADPAAPVPGGRVTYTLRLTNPGTAPYTAAVVRDDLSGVLDDAVRNDDARASTGTLDYSAPVLTWSGDVVPGTPVVITYSVTVGNPPAGDKVLRNAVTGPGDSTCEGACGTVTPLPALRIDKRGAPRDVEAGDTVTWTVTVTNTGEAPYPGASFTDDLGGVLDDAVWNGDARASVGTLDYSAPVLTWTGTLPAGATATVTYSVTATLAGDRRLANSVTATGSNCAPGSTDPACRDLLPAPLLLVRKTAQPAVATPGGAVTWTVTVTNTGEAPYPGASFTDDLGGVLDDA